MQNRGFWFEISLRAFAAIGVVAIFGLGIFGGAKLMGYRFAIGGGPGQTAAVIGVENKSTSSVAESTESAEPAAAGLTATSTTPYRGETQVKIYPRSSPSQVIPNGVSDLELRIVDTGIIDASGEFAVATSVPQNQQAAIVFEVVNIGTAPSEPWNFSANLPSPDGYFNSEIQPPLYPGDRIRFTMGFKDLNRSGENKAILTIDPKNAIRDANRNNDSAAATLIRD